tara:strand:+ start:2252 stop:2464 length:213 start_codon:yes stop_codon:yes gene_type:complete
MNQAAKQLLKAIEIVQSINVENDELTELFKKRRGRNPDALQRIRDRVQSATCALTPMLVEALHQPEEVEE